MIDFYIQLLVPIVLMFYSFSFKKRRHFWRLFIGYLAITLTASFFWKSTDEPSFLPTVVDNYLYYLVTYLLAFGLVVLCTEMPMLNKVFYSISAFLMQNVSHHAFQLGMRLASVPLGQEYAHWYDVTILVAVYAVVYFLFFFVLLRKKKIDDLMAMPKASTVFIASAFFLVMIIFGIYVRHIGENLLTQPSTALGYETYSVVLDVLMLSLQFGVFNNGKLQANNAELEMQLEHEGRYYEIAKANMEQINIKCHDLKHQIAALSNNPNEAAREASISELKDAVMIYDSLAKTGNDSLDCILSEKQMYCQQNGITFTIIGEGKCLSFMRPNDIYALFGNGIDNAIESVLKIEDKRKRIISLRIGGKGNMVHIHLENYCLDAPTIVDGLPKTTKSGQGHGYGMKSIRYIIEKYHGSLAISYHDLLFVLDILMPANED